MLVGTDEAKMILDKELSIDLMDEMSVQVNLTVARDVTRRLTTVSNSVQCWDIVEYCWQLPTLRQTVALEIDGGPVTSCH